MSHPQQLTLDSLQGELLVAFAGHRPDDRRPWRGVGGWKDTALHQGVRQWIGQQLDTLRPRKVVTGGAVGVDTWAALLALERGLHLVLAIPFEGQELGWPADSQRLYWEIRARASEVVNVAGLSAHTPGGKLPIEQVRRLMAARNRWMVDSSTLLLACWDGTPGGTGNCVQYADKIGRRIARLNPNTLRGNPWTTT